MHRLALSSLLVLALGCRGQSPAAGDTAEQTAAPAAPAPILDDMEITVSEGNGWLGTYVSSWKSFRTNSYWIEGPEGLVLIDVQFLPSAALKAVELAESLTGKKVVAAIVLHANPDKFNGAAVLQQRGVKVLTSDQVRALIPEVHALRHGWFYDSFKPDYPDDPPTLDSFGAATTELDLAGLKLKAHVLGAGCSEAHVVIEYEQHVFVGDLVAGMGHAWLELGLVDEWLARLSEIHALAPRYVHPGRGPSGGADLLGTQRAYLEKVIALVREEDPRPGIAGADKEAAIARIQERLLAAYPDYPMRRFAENGLSRVWDRLAAQPAAPVGTTAPGAAPAATAPAAQ
jgi:glyoxylase-like metal-dependent hydrolase (beta-lactamase superfamily II)